MQHEFARAAADVVWRRTKLGLFTSPAEQQALRVYLQRVELSRGRIQAA